MKLSPTSLITLPFAILATLSSTSAHMTIQNPLPRGHPLNPNAAVKDFDCIMAPLNGGGPCAAKPFPCGGYAQDTKITQTFRAGEVITVEFFNQNFPADPSNSDPNADQARHNGGTCEFSLSYDGGKTYTVIGTYKKTCPDIFFGWKVKIPSAAPTCDTPGKCLFSWSWLNAVGNREFYQNCADIKIEGNSTKPLPIIDINRANLPPLFPNIVTPPGDPANTGNAKGSGPLAEDTNANLNLQIGGGSGTGGSGSGSGSGTGGSGSGSGSGSGTGGSGSKPKKGRGRKGGKKSGSGNSCNAEGQMTCVSPGKTGVFNTCANGKIVTRSCTGDLVCKTAGDSIACDYA